MHLLTMERNLSSSLNVVLLKTIWKCHFSKMFDMSQKPTEIFISKNLNKKKIVIKFPMQVIGDYL